MSEELSQKIARLERRLRWTLIVAALSGLLAIALLVLLLAMLLSNTAPRALEQRASLAVTSQDGKSTLELHPDKILLKRDGEVRVGVFASADLDGIRFGTEDGPMSLLTSQILSLRDGERGTVNLGYLEGKAGLTILTSPEEDVYASLLVDQKGPALRVWNKKAYSTVRVSEERVPFVGLSREHDEPNGTVVALRNAPDWAGLSAMNKQGTRASVRLSEETEPQIFVNAPGEQARMATFGPAEPEARK